MPIVPKLVHHQSTIKYHQVVAAAETEAVVALDIVVEIIMDQAVDLKDDDHQCGHTVRPINRMTHVTVVAIVVWIESIELIIRINLIG